MITSFMGQKECRPSLSTFNDYNIVTYSPTLRMRSPGLPYLLVANLCPEATSLTHSTNHCRFLVLCKVTAWCVTKARVKKGSGDCRALWGAVCWLYSEDSPMKVLQMPGGRERKGKGQGYFSSRIPERSPELTWVKEVPPMSPHQAHGLQMNSDPSNALLPPS